MSDHVIPLKVLERFASHTATPEERRIVARHLLTGCKSCQEYLRKHWPSLSPSSNLAEFPTSRYTAAFDSSLRLYRPTGLLADLESHPPLRQELLIRNHPRYWRRELCQELADHAQGYRFSDTPSMRYFAGLAVLVSERFRPSRSARQDEDLRTRAWTELANALRASGELNAAEQAFVRAHFHIKASDAEPSLKARLLRQHASLLVAQRRLEAALPLLREATEIFRDLHDRQEVACCLIQEAIAASEASDPRSALSLLMEAERTIDPALDPSLALIIIHSRIRFLCEVRKTEEAFDLHDLASALYAQQAKPLMLTKLTWLRGQLLCARGHFEQAIEALTTVQQSFTQHGNWCEAGLVSIELAAVLGKVGRRQEMRTLAAASFQEMVTQGIRREALAALILLQKSV
jgi:tetratricopeptide (TPR) repeat protein